MCKRVAIVRHHAAVLVFDARRGGNFLLHQHVHALQQVDRLKTCHHQRALIVAGDKAVGVGANDHADVPRRQKRVDTVVRLVEQTAQRGNKRNVLTEKEEVTDLLRLRLLQGNSGGRHGGFKA